MHLVTFRKKEKHFSLYGWVYLVNSFYRSPSINFHFPGTQKNNSIQFSHKTGRTIPSYETIDLPKKVLLEHTSALKHGEITMVHERTKLSAWLIKLLTSNLTCSQRISKCFLMSDADLLFNVEKAYLMIYPQNTMCHFNCTIRKLRLIHMPHPLDLNSTACYYLKQNHCK